VAENDLQVKERVLGKSETKSSALGEVNTPGKEEEQIMKSAGMKMAHEI
jgi:hypothetical protein